jgi:hypothetical protein
MLDMRRSVRQKVVAAAAVAVLVGGGALAAVSATGQTNPRRASSAERRARRARAQVRDLATAAAYLGLSKTALASELQSGKTLAQIANATAGKSSNGLIEALEAARKARLTAAAARLPKRVESEVNRAGGPGAGEAGARHRQARQAKRLANLRKRITKLVQRQQFAGGASSTG